MAQPDSLKCRDMDVPKKLESHIHCERCGPMRSLRGKSGVCGNCDGNLLIVGPLWLTPEVHRLAVAARAEVLDGLVDPFLLTVLADAAEDNGCQEEAILRHLRLSVPHYQDCRALTLLLSKQPWCGVTNNGGDP